MLTTRKDLNSRIDALEAQIAQHDEAIEAANTAREGAESALEVATEELTASREDASRLTEENDALAEQIRQQADDLAARESDIESLRAELADDEPRIAKAAVASISSIGHEPVEATVTIQSGQLERADYEAQSAAIKDPYERARWRLENMGRVRN